MATKRIRRASTAGDELQKKFVRKRVAVAVGISDALERRNWTARRLAQEAGLKESFLSRILRGDANSTLKTISKIEVALGEEILVAPGYSPQTFSGEESTTESSDRQSDEAVSPSGSYSQCKVSTGSIVAVMIDW